jgi:hypothetical protein
MEAEGLNKLAEHLKKEVSQVSSPISKRSNQDVYYKLNDLLSSVKSSLPEHASYIDAQIRKLDGKGLEKSEILSVLDYLLEVTSAESVNPPKVIRYESEPINSYRPRIDYPDTAVRPMGIFMLGLMQIFMSLFYIAAGLLFSGVFGNGLSSISPSVSSSLGIPSDLLAVPAIPSGFGVFGIIFVAIGAASLIIGVMFMLGKNWARILMMIGAVIDLVLVPVGTILGIVLLVYLNQKAVIQYFNRNR